MESYPIFEKLGASYKEELDVILISLDEGKKYNTAVQPFLENNQIKS